MKAKMASEAGQRVYARRLAVVELVFANICAQERMNRFSLRTSRTADVYIDVARYGTQHQQNPHFGAL
ncbi:MAG: hypothetical protein ACOY16_00370 [Chloroflexota bacterium]